MTKIPDPHALMTTLAVMKKAKEQGINMCIWDRDIKAVEDAIDAIRALGSCLLTSNNSGTEK